MEQINATLVLDKLSTTLVDDSKKETTTFPMLFLYVNHGLLPDS